MKRKIFLLFFSFFSFLIYAADRKIIDLNNEFGGITEEYTILPSEKDYEQFSKLRIFYDENVIKRKEEFDISDSLKQKTGISIQEAIYKDGIITEYRMNLTEEVFERQGITQVIEILDSDGNTQLIGHSNGRFTAYARANSFVNNYPVYSLDFLDTEFFSDPKDKQNKEDSGNNIFFSAKYNKVRSFVKFTDDFDDLNDLDKTLISEFDKFLGGENSSWVALYTKKTTVESNNKKYTVYLQKNLLPYIKKDMDCLLAYGLIGMSGKFYLIATEFEEVK